MGALADFIAAEFREAAQEPGCEIRGRRAAKVANPAKAAPNFSNFSNFSRGPEPKSVLAGPVSGPEAHLCACGAVGLIATGWFLREPERARWFCSSCFEGLRAGERAGL